MEPDRRSASLRTRRAVGHALLSAARESDEGLPDRLPERCWREVVAATVFHRLPGYVHAYADRCQAPADVRAALAGLRDAAVGQHLVALAGLRLVGETLTHGNAPWLVLKGPVLADHAYGEPGLRSYGDLDVLIEPRWFMHALALLRDAGFRLLAHDWAELRREQAGQVVLEMPTGGHLDLHWHLINEAAVRESSRISTPELFERSRELLVGGVRVPTMAAEDSLLHLVVHTASSGGNRLVWLKDIERWIHRQEVDWDVVTERARAWGIGLAVALILRKSRRTVGARVPDTVLARCDRARVWSAIGRAVSACCPVAMARPGPSVDRLITRASRNSTARSLAELAGRSWIGMTERVGLQTRGRSTELVAGSGLADLLAEVCHDLGAADAL